MPSGRPVDLSHLDPQLAEGARCTVGHQLGVVKSVRQNGYIVELDGGNMITLDRFVAGHLTSLKPSTESRVASNDVVVLAKVGTANWQPESSSKYGPCRGLTACSTLGTPSPAISG